MRSKIIFIIGIAVLFSVGITTTAERDVGNNTVDCKTFYQYGFDTKFPNNAIRSPTFEEQNKALESLVDEYFGIVEREIEGLMEVKKRVDSLGKQYLTIEKVRKIKRAELIYSAGKAHDKVLSKYTERQVE